MKSVINLIRTPQGYSLLQGQNELGKNINKSQKQKSYSLSKKFIQQNFTIYPYIPNKQYDNHKYILIPAKTQWFNLNSVHQIQKKALPQWFKIKKGILATMVLYQIIKNNIKFEKHEELYKKYRNYIIDLGKNQYITGSMSRKGLAGDACAILRIHKFLQKWGLINYIHKKPINNTDNESKDKKSMNISMNKRKDCFERDKGLVARNYNKDDLQLLKKITRKFRPICHFCEGITGVIWYEYNENFHLKKIDDRQQQKCANMVIQPQIYNYILILCASCFYEGSYPVILTSMDFKKRTIGQKIQQQINYDSDKKKNNEQNKIADTIQKNRFKISKTAQQLKSTPIHIFTVLMTMPVQKLQKISRIQPQTDIEQQQSIQQSRQQVIVNNNRQFDMNKFEENIIKQVNELESEQRQIYQKLLQTWLIKMNLKLQKLSDWQNCISVRYNSISRLQKNNLAQKVKLLSKSL